MSAVKEAYDVGAKVLRYWQDSGSKIYSENVKKQDALSFEREKTK